MVFALIAAFVVRTTVLNVDRIEFDSPTITASNLASSRLTLIWREGKEEVRVPARIYGVEPFSTAEREKISENKGAIAESLRNAQHRKIRCGPIDIFSVLTLGLLLHPDQPLRILQVGQDPDGTLVVDYEFDSKARLSHYLLKEGACKIDPQISGLDIVATRMARAAKDQCLGNWRWLHQIVPPQRW